MSRRTGRPPTLFRQFLRGGSTLPEWQTVQAVLTATGETSPQAINAYKRRWTALNRGSEGRVAELARRHKSRRLARLPSVHSAQLYDDPGTYATDTPGTSWPVTLPRPDKPVPDGGTASTPLNKAIAATTSAEYVAAMAELARATKKSYAQIATGSGGELSKSSAHRIATGYGTGDRLPAKRVTLAAYLVGCGVGDQLELRLWLQKWDQLRGTRPVHEDDVYYALAGGLLSPKQVYSREEAVSRRSLVPAQRGVYAWYFDEVPPGVPTEGCRVGEFGTLLYVGLAPKAPPAKGARPSKQHLRQRIGYHFGGNAYGSTLRLALGCHLTEQLGIELRRVGSGTRLTFTKAGENMLSEWMEAHARVAFILDDEPWKLEPELIKREILPLNIAGNAHSPYYLSLRALRDEHRRRARELPVTS